MENHRVAVIPTRLAVALLLAAAIFLIEAGVVEIMLANEASCQEGLSHQRLAPSQGVSCLPEWQVFMLRAFSRGIIGLLLPNAPAILGLLSMVLIYVLLGGACSRLTTHWGIAVFIGTQIALTALVAGLMYIAQYIG